MKFTDGLWQLQPGVTSHSPVEARAITRDEHGLVVHTPTRHIRHRGDTLGGPLLTWTLSSPMEGVIRVRLEHYAGAPNHRPGIPLTVKGHAAVIIEETDAAVLLHAGALSARVAKKGWALSFESGGRVLTRSGPGGAAYLTRDGVAYVREKLSLGVGECVYGLGERFTAFVKNGQTVENVNKDGGTSSDQAYKAVPFYLTNRGYGVLVNETGHVSFEVASEHVSHVQFSQAGENLEYFVILGPTPKEVLARLTALTGRPALPPAWSFGLWLTTSFTTSYDEATCTSFIEGMKQRDLPLHVFHFDCFWMREFDWCDFRWDPAVFPDPEGMLKRLHDRGLKVCVWINPYIGQRSPLFADGMAGGYFIKRRNGSVWQTDQWQPGMAIVDFTNPAACAWYAGHLRRLLAMGVDSFKTDFGERIPTEGVVYHDGSDPLHLHNLYPVRYNECVFNVLEEVRGKGEAVLFARSTYASGQRLPVHWGGDCQSTLESMAESLRGGLSLGLCGFGFWSHDIGGFEGLPPASVYKRWVAFGLLSSHSRLHGSTSYRVPWNYDEEACDVLRHFTRLKCTLMPALYAAAVESTSAGLPVMRAMVLEFPADPACATLDRQYLLGPALLVAPVFTESGEVEFYLPAGRWTRLLTGEVVEGGRWLRETHGFLGLPLYVRPGTLLPLGGNPDRPDYDYSKDLTVRLYELSDGQGASCDIPRLDGTCAARLTATRAADKITLSWTGDLPGLTIELVNVAAARSCTGATA
jgi:alpha-D-xyloside xylohydrolase